MRWNRSTLCSLLAGGCLLLSWLFFPETVQAAWPITGRDFTDFYTCSSYRSSSTGPWSEPECTVVTWFNELISDVIETDAECEDVGCSLWVRRYIVPAIGVQSFAWSCEYSDILFESASLTNVSFIESSSHLVRAGPGSTTGNGVATYNLVYSATHTSGVDLWTNLAHDPYYQWTGDHTGGVANGQLAWQVFAGTSQNNGLAHATTNCIIFDWQGEWAPEPTPTPGPTSTPSATPVATPTFSYWPTLIPWATAIPTVTLVPAWDVDIGFSPTVSDTECYVFIGSIPVTTTDWLEFLGLPVPTYDDVGICVEPFDMDMQVGPWDIGRLAYLLVAVGCVVAVWRMFDS